MNRRTMLSISFAWAVMLVLPAVGWASHLPGVLSNTSVRHPFLIRPAVVSYTGDGTGFVGGFDGTGRASGGRGHFGHVTWLAWTNKIATGTGALWGDNCEPDCARGTFSPVRVKVRAFAPHGGHFTRLTLRYEQNGEKYIDERGVKFYNSVVPGQHGYYEYFIVREVHEYVASGTMARTKPVYLPSECTNQVQRPRIFLIGCRGGDTGVDKLVWHAWGNPIAQGVGFAFVNDCEPNCATGGIHYTPAEMYVSRVRLCRGHRQYTYAVVVVAEGRAHPLTGAYEIPCGGSQVALTFRQPGP
jgi:hypothetical protein